MGSNLSRWKPFAAYATYPDDYPLGPCATFPDDYVPEDEHDAATAGGCSVCIQHLLHLLYGSSTNW